MSSIRKGKNVQRTLYTYIRIKRQRQRWYLVHNTLNINKATSPKKQNQRKHRQSGYKLIAPGCRGACIELTIERGTANSNKIDVHETKKNQRAKKRYARKVQHTASANQNTWRVQARATVNIIVEGNQLWCVNQHNTFCFGLSSP